MKKICLTVLGLYLMVLHAFGQASSNSTDNYKNLDLRTDEVNIISGYYSQNGNHSPVTGGIGTQQLTDVSNTIQIRLLRWDILERKHTTEWELGIDHHTAASSAYVSKTGASKTGGTRLYPSVTWKLENEETRTTMGWGLSYSNEYNYHSYGSHLEFAKTSKDQNRELNIKAQLYLDRVKLIQPSELIPAPTAVTPTTYTTASGRTRSGFLGGEDHQSIPSKPRNTFNTSLSLSQVINKNLQFSALVDGIVQTGYLGLPFHRVYWNDKSVHVENMPVTRYKLPLGLRVNYFAGDHVVFRAYYRYYLDNWGVKAHTASMEIPLKLTSFVSVAPFLRYYKQTAAYFFAPYGIHSSTDKYYTSNYDYSAFHSEFVGVNIRLSPPRGVMGISKFNLLEIRAGHYVQTTGLEANNVGVNLRFK